MEEKGIKNYEKIYLLIFLLAEIAVFPIVFMRHERMHSVIYYFAIVLCFLTAVVCLRRNRASLFTLFALLFTCVADFFLILLGTEKLLAMCAFTVTQLFYCARTLSLAEGKGERVANIAVRVALSLIAASAVFIVLREQTEALFVVSLVYYANLLVNIVFAFLHFRCAPLLAIGLLLFAMCDAVIGLSFVEDIFMLPPGNFIDVLWSLPIHLESFFYQPSQVLLAISTLNTRK